MESNPYDLGPRKKFVKTLAEKVLKSVGISAAPVSLQRVIENIQKTYDLSVKRMNVGEKVSGLLVVCKEVDAEYVNIGFNSNHPWCRRRFTIAHEIGHLLLGHMCSDNQNDGTHNEKEANLFAAELLMPAKLIKKDFANINDVQELAQLYRVSSQALTIRLIAARLV
jgi:Zn-dependent peptidase ImmA (M78 family)